MRRKPTKVITIDNGHLRANLAGGGDTFLIEVFKRIDQGRVNAIIFTDRFGEGVHRDRGLVTRTMLWTPRGNRLNPVISGGVRTLLGALEIPRMLLRENPDVLVVASDFLFDSLPTALTPSLGRIKKVFLMHMIPPAPTYGYSGKLHLPNSSELLHWISNRVTILLGKLERAEFIVVHPDIGRFLQRRYKIPSRNIQLILYGVSHCQESVADGHDFDGIYVARFHPQKGFQDLIEIWQRVCKSAPAAKLAIVGPDTEKLVPALHDSHLSNNVKVFGYRTYDNLTDLMRRSKLFIMPSHFESFSIVTLEAMAQGLPVIAYDLPVFKAIFPGGISKIACYNTDKFADEVLKLLEDKPARQSLAREGLKIASQHTWDTASANFQQFLLGLNNAC